MDDSVEEFLSLTAFLETELSGFPEGLTAPIHALVRMVWSTAYERAYDRGYAKGLEERYVL